MSIDMGIILDPISVMMLVVVTFVSLMVHIYSLGYMKGEERFATYYSFLWLVYFFNAGLSMSHQIFSRSIFSGNWLAYRLILLIGYYYDQPVGSRRFKESIHRDTFC